MFITFHNEKFLRKFNILVSITFRKITYAMEQLTISMCDNCLWICIFFFYCCHARINAIHFTTGNSHWWCVHSSWWHYHWYDGIYVISVLLKYLICICLTIVIWYVKSIWGVLPTDGTICRWHTTAKNAVIWLIKFWVGEVVLQWLVTKTTRLNCMFNSLERILNCNLLPCSKNLIKHNSVVNNYLIKCKCVQISSRLTIVLFLKQVKSKVYKPGSSEFFKEFSIMCHLTMTIIWSLSSLMYSAK